ncbi:PLP-dependent aminotransferase family protein [Gordonia sp. ABSL49_1]|uniref:MocR-like pyridoxine biosynthesis transcription factor PdxR n=1 Tax=Gordonia sp. ABSL49_1 TaxID=2920941 RepID=UPI001F104605|nr:PLP-dependent aminotransferase family protein [Gordonia sp. ABSL49_1]MCH5642106.1 PLP-dependent aminotransferase family protein [Gordonia sp. ABSL49_1]
MADMRVNSENSPDTDPWDSVARRLGTDLYLDLQPDPDGNPRGRGSQRRHTLAAALRHAISTGQLPPGSLLPPYRSLAADLGLARNTVSAVYTELIAEGWLTARRGSGTRVASGVVAEGLPGVEPRAPQAQAMAQVRHDFSMGQPNAGLFPRADWINATRHALTRAPDSAFAPSHPGGRPELREALRTYLARARGVRTTAESIVLMTAVQASLELLARTVLGPRVAVEAYGLPFHRDALVRGGADIVPIRIDDNGLLVDDVERAAPTAVLVTPSHQYPTGVALHPERRMRLVEWARRTGALIVEDDYDGELRYDRDPVGALQGLAPDVVIYTGSVSKSLSPAVRAGWLVLPSHLIDPVTTAKGAREPDASIVDQLVLAEMITSGTYDRHIRRSRQVHRRRRDQLTDRLASIGIEIPGIAAGLHVLIPVPRDDEPTVVARAHADGIAVFGLDLFRHADAEPLPQGGIAVGFGTPAASAFDAGLDALTRLIRPVPASP